MPPRPTPPGYRFAMVLAGATMTFLALGYVTIIAVVATGLYASARMLKDLGDMPLFAAFFWFTLPAAMALLLYSLLKPLWARNTRGRTSYTVNREKEPRLFQFIDQCCDATGAPRPDRIEVTCDVDARASRLYRQGSRSLTLGFGLGLVAGLTQEQFAALVTHEAGHLAQKGGMGLRERAVSVLEWFRRAAYERDTIDTALAERSDPNAENTSGPLLMNPIGRLRIIGFLFIWVLQIFVYIARAFLAGLYKLGCVVMAYFARQRELDADRLACELAGSTNVAALLRRVCELAGASRVMHRNLRRQLQRGLPLPDNLPFHLLDAVAEVRPTELARLTDESTPTGVFDLHPALGERIRAMKAIQAPGICTAPGPAVALFSNFPALAQQVTRVHYLEDLGIPLDLVGLHPVRDPYHAVVAAPHDPARDEALLAQLGHGLPLGWRQPVLEKPAPTDNWDALVGRAKSAAADLARQADDLRALGSIWTTLDQRRLVLLQAQALVAAGLRIDAAGFGLPDARPESIQVALGATTAEIATHTPRLEAAEALLMRACLSSIQLAFEGPVAEESDDAAGFREEVQELLPPLMKLGAIQALRDQVRSFHYQLHALLSQRPNHPGSAPLESQIRHVCAHVRGRLDDVESAVSDVPHPFPREAGPVALGRVLNLDQPKTDDTPAYLAQRCHAQVEVLGACQRRALARLLEIADQLAARV